MAIAVFDAILTLLLIGVIVVIGASPVFAAIIVYFAVIRLVEYLL